MKKLLILFSCLGIFACKKYGSELNNGKDGCIDCVLKIDSIKGMVTTFYELNYDMWTFTTNRTDWCNYLDEMNGKTQINDTIYADTVFIKYNVSCK